MRLFASCFQAAVVLFLSGCDKSPTSASPSTGDVAVFAGGGVWMPSLTAVLAVLHSQGLSADTISEAGQLANNLRDHQLLIIPGGNPDDLLPELGPVGRSAIIEFVNNGGGCIGLGGGAAILARMVNDREGIPLLNGTTHWPLDAIAPYPEYRLIDIRLTSPNHPIGMGGRTEYTTLYRWGPDFSPSDSALAEVIYRYEATDTPAAVAFDFGFGRVFLAGFQPEIEENSDRDSTDFASELTDPDSEWDILIRAIDFCWPY